MMSDSYMQNNIAIIVKTIYYPRTPTHTVIDTKGRTSKYRNVHISYNLIVLAVL